MGGMLCMPAPAPGQSVHQYQRMRADSLSVHTGHLVVHMSEACPQRCIHSMQHLGKSHLTAVHAQADYILNQRALLMVTGNEGAAHL